MARRQDPVFAKSVAAQVDYSNYVSTTSQGTIYQTTDAPEEYQLNPLDPFDDVANFDTWLDDVYRVLRQKGLWRFIDQDIPRPPRDSVDTDR
jgi:hypothetical protein